jgi:hypothetical protein
MTTCSSADLRHSGLQGSSQGLPMLREPCAVASSTQSLARMSGAQAWRGRMSLLCVTFSSSKILSLRNGDTVEFGQAGFNVILWLLPCHHVSNFKC